MALLGSFSQVDRTNRDLSYEKFDNKGTVYNTICKMCFLWVTPGQKLKIALILSNILSLSIHWQTVSLLGSLTNAPSKINFFFHKEGKPKNEYGLFFNEGGLWSYANTNIFKTTFVTCKIRTERRKWENAKATIGGKIRKILSNEP